MINGIIFFEGGGYQIVGEIGSFRKILNTMTSLTKEIESVEKQRNLADYTIEEMEELIKAKKANQDKEVLEP